MLDVIGAGFGRTGTLSLKHALEHLGFGPCHHMSVLSDDSEQVLLWTRVLRQGLDDWDEVYGDYRSTADWPGARYWRELTGHFSKAKVILTLRDPERWYESCEESIHRAITAVEEGGPPFTEMELPADATLAEKEWFVNRRVWEDEFDGRFADKEHAIRVFTEHYDAVRREIPADRLLEFHVGQGWDPLCRFLGVPVPDDPFPSTHDRREFADAIEGG